MAKGKMTWIEWKDFSPSGIAKTKKMNTRFIYTKSGKAYYWGMKKR